MVLFDLNQQNKNKNKNILCYQCNICNKTAVRNENFKRHMITHCKDSWKHKCSICDKTFSRSDSLKRHVDNHFKYLEL